jgi:hypothetical protein
MTRIVTYAYRNELGHFARDYRKVFGEPPSQTLRRAKNGEVL